jgi:hypothetical protein
MLASLGAVSVNTWYEVDVTSLVTGDGTYSLRISSTSTNGEDYSSKEGARFTGTTTRVMSTINYYRIVRGEIKRNCGDKISKDSALGAKYDQINNRT